MKAIRLLRYLSEYFAMTHKGAVMSIQEAIAELEALQQRSCCDGCVREAEDMVDPHCAFCSRACKDNYESKKR